jgi:phage recombination protein Bet
MTAATAESKTELAKSNSNTQIATFKPPRLPFHPEIENRFGVTKAEWKALVEAVFPLATSVDSVVLALSYCKARKLDPFKRNVHIVPIYSKQLSKMIDTVWPGIGELRTTAFRTGQYAGRGETVYGPDITQKVGSLEITFPEWAQVTVQRLVKDRLVNFTGPRVYWLETYSTASRNDVSPNSMWARRVRGQIEKCAEAAALRAAFPEEIGNEYTNDEAGQMQYDNVINATATVKPAIDDGRSASDRLADIVEGSSTPEVADAVVEHSIDELTPVDDEPPTQDQEEPQQSRGEYLSVEGETAGKYVARIKQAITDAQDGATLDQIGEAIQVEYDRFEKPEYETVLNSIEVRRKALLKGKSSGKLVN